MRWFKKPEPVHPMAVPEHPPYTGRTVHFHRIGLHTNVPPLTVRPTEEFTQRISDYVKRWVLTYPKVPVVDGHQDQPTGRVLLPVTSYGSQVMLSKSYVVAEFTVSLDPHQN